MRDAIGPCTAAIMPSSSCTPMGTDASNGILLQQHQKRPKSVGRGVLSPALIDGNEYIKKQPGV